ncbi:alpha-amylase family protein [Devosia sp. XGJD_8]|uniref:alpha-amylase family protein n=1 Tax=Devosia sp. XGJD_8 TaxID=3391187 RepID=UPI0039849032
MLHEHEQRSVAGTDTKTWWQRPYRMVQTNLRQPDALYDQKKLAREVKEFGADVLLYNIGGIYAFYPTKLELHAINPLMQGDALGDAIEAAHSEGIALVGRFDMSKATRLGYEAHPDWFVHNAKGESLEYNGTYQACVNGGWYQDYSLQIISESLGKYDVDGVFFNMFGYTNFNYSGLYFGTCVCENCRRRFHDMYGKPLPLKEDFSDPSYADYLEFKDRTSLELRAKVYKHIKQVAPKVAMTGHRGDSDLIRMETQRAVDRPQPEWPYQAGEQARWGQAYGQGKTVSSTSANFIDFAWRFVSETGAYQLARGAQQLASGATLDFYLLGVMDQDDKSAFADTSKLFHWHKANEANYSGLKPASKIALYHSHAVVPGHGAGGYAKRPASGQYAEASFRGAYRALVEARLPFDLVVDEIIAGKDGAKVLGQYEALVLPNVTCMSDAEVKAIDAWVKAGGVLMATGETGLYDEKGAPRDKPALASLPITGKPMARQYMKGAYFRVRPGELPIGDVKLLMMDHAYYVAEPTKGAETLLTLLPPQRFGPPELCFPDYESEMPGAIIGAHGKGKAIYVPWHADALYYRDSLPHTRTFLTDLVVRNISAVPVKVEGPGALELTIQAQPETGKLLVHLINYSGQRNNLYEDAPPLHGLRIGIKGVTGSGTALVAGKTVAPEGKADGQGYLWYALPPVTAFEAIQFSTK